MLRALVLLLIVMGSVAFAQTQENKERKETDKAYIFAELRKANDYQVKKLFDEFDNRLMKDFGSKNELQGYIINYGTDKEIARREKQIRESITFRRIDSYRLTFVRAVNNGTLKTVFWIVPRGAEPPTP